MSYHFNFTLIWRYFDKLSWGLALSLELAAVCIAFGIVIGLARARRSMSRPDGRPRH